MNLAMFIGSLDRGGAERQFLQIGRSLQAREHNVLFVTIFPGGRYWSGAKDTFGDDLIALFPKASRFRLGRLAQLLTAPWRLRQLLRRRSVEIIYSALELSNLIAWLSALWQGQLALVWGVRDSDPFSYGDWRRHIPIRAMALVSRSVPLMISNSHAGRSDYRKAGFSPAAFEVVFNGIDTDTFQRRADEGRAQRQKWNISSETFLIGIVGRDSDQKDYKLFFTVLELLDTGCANYGAAIIGVRDGAADFGARLQLTGMAARSIVCAEAGDMPAVYSAIDVLCSTSVSEGFSNAIAEAMACECRCVATDVGDSREIIGDTGIVVPYGDATLLAEAIESMRLSAHQCARGARERIVSLFSIDKTAAETERALERVLRARGGRGV